MHAVLGSLSELMRSIRIDEENATDGEPEGLDAFAPLLDDARLKELAKKLHSLELELARSSESEHEEKAGAFGSFSAQAALRIEVKAFTSEVKAKITQITKGLREAPPEEELEGKWTELIPVVLQEEDNEEEKVNEMCAQWKKSSLWDKHRMCIATQIRLGLDDQMGLKLIYECANAILSDVNDDFRKVYESVHAYVSDTEKQHPNTYSAAIRRLQAAVRGDPTQLRQREEASEAVTLLSTLGLDLLCC